MQTKNKMTLRKKVIVGVCLGLAGLSVANFAKAAYNEYKTNQRIEEIRVSASRAGIYPDYTLENYQKKAEKSALSAIFFGAIPAAFAGKNLGLKLLARGNRSWGCFYD